MPKPWSHLPNAALIDRVIADLGANTETGWAAAEEVMRGAGWTAARNAAWASAGASSRDAVWDAAWDAAWASARGEARGEARDAVWPAARDAVLALVAWDDCDHLLDLEPDQVRVLALLGHHPAVLLLPAVIALNKSITYSA